MVWRVRSIPAPLSLRRCSTTFCRKRPRRRWQPAIWSNSTGCRPFQLGSRRCDGLSGPPGLKPCLHETWRSLSCVPPRWRSQAIPKLRGDKSSGSDRSAIFDCDLRSRFYGRPRPVNPSRCGGSPDGFGGRLVIRLFAVQRPSHLSVEGLVSHGHRIVPSQAVSLSRSVQDIFLLAR